MPLNCCVYGCASVYSNSADVSFHRFPKRDYTLRKWLLLLKLRCRINRATSRVCSLHFSESQYTESMTLKERAVPDKNLPSSKARSKPKKVIPAENVSIEIVPPYQEDITESADPLGDFAVDNIVEVIDDHTPKLDTSEYRTYSRSQFQPRETVMPQEYFPNYIVGEIEVESSDHAESESSSQAYIDTSCEPSSLPSEMISGVARMLTANGLLEGGVLSGDIKYLTGHSHAQFMFIYHFVISDQDERSWPNKTLSLIDQMLLTFIKFRHNFDYQFLGIAFKIHHSTVSTIFRYWTNLLFERFNRVDFWQMRAKEDGLYTVILDCTEIPIQKPKSPAEQQATWSSYKNTNTYKALIGIDEAGTVTFVSTLYGGSMTDDGIVAESGILGKLEEGDYVLADRGFEITDLLAEKGIILNKPPKKKGTRMSEEDVADTRAIASRRVNVERVIGLAKKNKILTQRVPHCLFIMISKILRLLFLLTNVRPSICQRTERSCRCNASSAGNTLAE